MPSRSCDRFRRRPTTTKAAVEENVRLDDLTGGDVDDEFVGPSTRSRSGRLTNPDRRAISADGIRGRGRRTATSCPPCRRRPRSERPRSPTELLRVHAGHTPGGHEVSNGKAHCGRSPHPHPRSLGSRTQATARPNGATITGSAKLTSHFGTCNNLTELPTDRHETRRRARDPDASARMRAGGVTTRRLVSSSSRANTPGSAEETG